MDVKLYSGCGLATINVCQTTSGDTGKFMLRNLAALTNIIHCNPQHGALLNRFPVMMTPIGWREFPTISDLHTSGNVNIGSGLAVTSGSH